VLADMQTFFEHRGDIAGKKVAWVGDGNNMCNTYIEAASLLDFELTIAVPTGFEPALLAQQDRPNVRLVSQPTEAVKDAALVVTDVWASMGQEQEAPRRREIFAPYQVLYTRMVFRIIFFCHPQLHINWHKLEYVFKNV
jgi:ornithine carbamoyltransferase